MLRLSTRRHIGEIRAGLMANQSYDVATYDIVSLGFTESHERETEQLSIILCVKKIPIY